MADVRSSLTGDTRCGDGIGNEISVPSTPRSAPSNIAPSEQAKILGIGRQSAHYASLMILYDSRSSAFRWRN
ncbi:MAG: hypothetical protein ACLRWQ_03545 [Flavonifractor plautii]